VTTTEMTQSTRDLTFAGAINDALDIALGTDSTVLLLGEDIADPPGGVVRLTQGLSTKYGTHRVRATPISEQAIVGAAIGAALGGLRPVAEIMLMDFITLVMDQLVNHAAKHRYMSGGTSHLPLTVHTRIGHRRGAQHSSSYEAWFMHVPGIKVCVPATAADAKGLLLSCIFDDDPCLYLEPTPMVRSRHRSEVPTGDYRVPIGQAAIPRAGSDVSIISYGQMTPAALDAAATLADEGISAEVVDLRSLVPLDHHTVLTSVAKTRRAVVTHAAARFGGPGAEISAMIHEELFGQLERPVRRVATASTPVPFAPSLAQIHSPDASTIAESVREVMR
jgi:acetoin:2,6-dichlorophenolindophenol oxidoreductase subunit beta